MPIYPAAPATLSGDTFNINRFLDNPAFLDRRLRTLSDRKFLADYIFVGRIEASGGAIGYTIGEPTESDRSPGAVNPGAEYPRAQALMGTAALANITKWGQDVPLTDEAIGRQRNASITVDRVLLKVINKIVAHVDGISLATLAALITQTQGAVAAWTAAGADPFRDVMRASAQVNNLTDGFNTDTVIVTETLYAELVANQKVISGLAREGTNQVTATGDVKVIAGHTLLPVPDSRMPPGTSVMVMDRMQIGSLGYERIPSPEYKGDPANGVESSLRRDPSGNDQWLIRGRRPVVPIVEEPSAGVKITGA